MSDEEQGGLFAKMAISLGGIHETLGKMHKIQNSWIQRDTYRPRDLILQLTGISTSTTVAFTLGSTGVGGLGPEQGEIWLVRRISVGGVTPGTTVSSSSAQVFQSPTDPNQLGGTGPTANWVASFSSLPGVQFFSNRQIVLKNGDNLFISVLGPATNQQIQANVQIECYNDGGYKAVVDL
jgi:hypothetical protein